MNPSFVLCAGLPPWGCNPYPLLPPQKLQPWETKVCHTEGKTYKKKRGMNFKLKLSIIYRHILYIITNLTICQRKKYLTLPFLYIPGKKQGNILISNHISTHMYNFKKNMSVWLNMPKFYGTLLKIMFQKLGYLHNNPQDTRQNLTFKISNAF